MVVVKFNISFTGSFARGTLRLGVQRPLIPNASRSLLCLIILPSITTPRVAMVLLNFMDRHLIPTPILLVFAVR